MLTYYEGWCAGMQRAAVIAESMPISTPGGRTIEVDHVDAAAAIRTEIKHATTLHHKEP